MEAINLCGEVSIVQLSVVIGFNFEAAVFILLFNLLDVLVWFILQ